MRPYRFLIQTLAVILMAAATAVSALAQLPITRLTTVFPPGGRAGSTVEVEVSGLDFEDINRLAFSHPGITAKLKEGTANRFVVNLATNTPLGAHEVWVNGRFGNSNPRIFIVGTQEERLAPGGINSPDKAADLPLNVPTHGRASGNLADWFKLTLKAGQRVVLECLGPEIDSRMQPSLALLDGAGRELKLARLGGVLDFKATADGTFLVKVHDFLFRGNAEYYYRLTASTAPHLDFALPPAGLAGTKQKVTLFGRNLPGGKATTLKTADGDLLEQLEVEIPFPAEPLPPARSLVASGPASGSASGFDYTLASPQGPSNPLFLSIATAPVVSEVEPNDDPVRGQTLKLPCEVGGQFLPTRDRDWYRFEAKKGEAWWIEVFAHRLGLNCNPFLLIQRVTKNDKGEETGADIREVYDDGTNLGGREFNTATRDVITRFEVPEDGVYRILVRGLFNQSHDNPALVYRLSIRKDAPDFRLVAMPDSPPPIKNDQRNIDIVSAVVRRGESLPLNVYAYRRDGFGGDINLSVEGLPPGLRVGPAKIEAGRNSAQLILTADESAAPWSGSLKIVGKSSIGGAETTRIAGAATLEWNVGDWNTQPVLSRLSASLPVTVLDIEQAPISFLPAEAKAWEAKENTKLDIPLKVIRRADFDAALKLKAVGLAALDKLPELDVDGKATNATLSIDLTKFKLPPGTHSFYLRTQTAGKYRNNPEAAAKADADAKAAEKAAADAAAASKAAADALTAANKAAEDAANQAKAASANDKAALEAKAKAAADAKATAEKAASEAAAKVKQAEDAKKSAADRAKAANEKAKPRDVTIMAYSPTIQVVISPAPPAPPAK